MTRKTASRTAASRFPPSLLGAIAASKLLGVRSGTEHRFTAVWVVVARGRVFVRSWNNRSRGWYQAFVARPLGTIRLPTREISVRAKKVRGSLLLDDIDQTYQEKYHTRASLKWVRGLRLPSRRATTLEFVPR